MDFNLERPIEGFDTKELTPIKSLRSDPPAQYFTNINSVYCKDVAGREELDELKALVDDVPWQPLEDGYSNFWFELTNDTLSPWLNFSAKNNNATIDWGDGSGEVALDTLTPTHTYSKAGKYVVKVKGVTGIGRQVTVADVVLYPLVYVELSEDVTNISSNTFYECVNLKEASIYTASLPNGIFLYCYSLRKVHMHSNPATISGQAFQDCRVLRSFDLTGVTTLADNVFYACRYFTSITLPATIDTMRNNIFNGCLRLSEIHIQATTPPTLGNIVFNGLPSDYIIYVPVGTGDTYKAASGWSTYADHILEEGETPTRAMLAKFNSAKTEEPQDDMR